MRAAAAALILFVSACAARPVTPVALSQPGDATANCAVLDEQIKRNAVVAAEMLGKDKQVEDANTGKVIASLVFGILVGLSIDLTREEQIMMRSLQDRNQYLQSLSRGKGCADT